MSGSPESLAREALEDAKRATAAPWWSIVNENTHLYVNSTDAIVAMVYRRPPRCGGTVLMPFGENTRWICNARTREPLLAQSVLSLAARVGDLEEALREIIEESQSDSGDDDPEAISLAFNRIETLARAALAAPRETGKE